MQKYRIFVFQNVKDNKIMGKTVLHGSFSKKFFFVFGKFNFCTIKNTIWLQNKIFARPKYGMMFVDITHTKKQFEWKTKIVERNIIDLVHDQLITMVANPNQKDPADGFEFGLLLFFSLHSLGMLSVF